MNDPEFISNQEQSDAEAADNREERVAPAIGAAVTFIGGNGKPWIIISRYKNKRTGIDELGLCDGTDFKYHKLDYVLSRANSCKVDQALVDQAFHSRDIRNIGFEKFTQLQEYGQLPVDIDIEDSDTRKAIRAITRLCAVEVTDPTDSDQIAAYTSKVKAALHDQFCQTKRRKLPSPKERPLLNNQPLRFSDPLEILAIEIDGQPTEVVTIRFIQRLLQGDTSVEISNSNARQWLEKNQVAPLPYKTVISFGKKSAVGAAYNLQAVRKANAIHSYTDNVLEESELPLVDDKGYVEVGTASIENDIRHWTIDGFTSKYALPDNQAVAKTIQRVFPDIKPIDALLRLKNSRTQKVKVYPETVLEEIRTLLLDNDRKVDLTPGSSTDSRSLSTISSYVEPTMGSAQTVYILKQNVEPITLSKLVEFLGVKFEDIETVMDPDPKRKFAVRRITTADGSKILLYTTGSKGQLIGQSVVLLPTDQHKLALEPARIVSEMENQLQLNSTQ